MIFAEPLRQVDVSAKSFGCVSKQIAPFFKLRLESAILTSAFPPVQEWVNPVFKECDYLMIGSHVPMRNEHDVLQCSSERQRCTESNEGGKKGRFFHQLQTGDDLLLLGRDGGPQSGDCVGHISIHTVTLSEEEGFEEDGGSPNPAGLLRSDPDGESLEAFVEGMEEEAADGGLLPGLRRQASNASSEENGDILLRVQFLEAERASLDSLALKEGSEDGYPHVDLDTFDSGFGEYNSPGASPGTEPMQSLHQHMSFHSNYVKQWIVSKAVEEG